MHASIQRDKAMRAPGPYDMFHVVVIRFSRLIGTEPPLDEYPELERALMFGPLAPISFRIHGPEKLQHAEEEFREEIARFGCMTSLQLTPEERQRMDALSSANNMKARAG